MTTKKTTNFLKMQLIGVNNLLGVKEGETGHCYLSIIYRSGLRHLYQVKQVIDKEGTTRDFLSTGNVPGAVLSKVIAAFNQAFRLAHSKEWLTNGLSKILDHHSLVAVDRQNKFIHPDLMEDYSGAIKELTVVNSNIGLLTDRLISIKNRLAALNNIENIGIENE